MFIGLQIGVGICTVPTLIQLRLAKSVTSLTQLTSALGTGDLPGLVLQEDNPGLRGCFMILQ